MLRTNLATRPFYNQRAVRVALGAAAVLAVVWSIYTAARIVSLTARNADLSARAATAEARVQELGNQSRQIRDALNRADVSATEAAANEANLMIDRRAFSWTSLFNRFEETLPADVRITAVQPQIDRSGRFILAISVMSRSVEAVDAFISELEKSGAFHSTLPVSEALQQDETFRSVIQTFYTPAAAKPAATSEPAEGGAPPDAGTDAPAAVPARTGGATSAVNGDAR